MLADATFAPLLRLPTRLGPRRLFVATWTVIAAAAIGLRYLDRALVGDRNDARAIGADVALLVLWALAAPTIMRSARRFPIRGELALRHGTMHLAMASSFILATNIAIRLPMYFAASTSGTSTLVRSLAAGLVRFGPTALFVYGVILAIGHVTRREAHPDAPSPAARAHPARVRVREWNRVHLVRAEEVQWVESDGNYVIVQTAARTYKGRGRIRDLETELDPAAFVRIHRSAIVAVDRVAEVQSLTKGDLAVVLRDGKVLRVARSRRSELHAALGWKQSI